MNQNLNLLRSMLRIRRIEEALADRYSEQEMRCPMHLCIGQEAIAVGVSESLKSTDRVYSNHRAHGHYLAKGADLNSMVAEIYGRSTGCCGGRGGSMHLIDLEAGFMGATPIVGGTVPIAVGSAWASKLQGTNDITVIYFGDGCFEEGVMHESINFAALHKLPIIFVCENNDFSVYTRLDERQPNRKIYQVAAAYGINSYFGNGSDVEEVLEISKQAVHEIKNGNGPQFLEFNVYRWREHCGPHYDDELGYRTEEEIEKGKSHCPVSNYIKKLNALYPDIDNLTESFETEITKEIEAAFKFALESKQPNPDDAKLKVYV